MVWIAAVKDQLLTDLGSSFKTSSFRPQITWFHITTGPSCPVFVALGVQKERFAQ